MPTSVLRSVRDSPTIKAAARLGLVARGVFYLVLAALVIVVVRGHAGGRQADANGALTTVGTTALGRVLLTVAAAGFAAFGVVRIAGAATDRQHGVLRRLSTAGQGVMYLAVAAVTSSYLLGRRSAGSEQQQRGTTRTLLTLPAGRLVVAGVGLVLLGVCGWQLLVAMRGQYADSLRTEQMSHGVRRLTRWTARVGIPARALAFAPIGVFLVVAGATANANRSKGLDGILSTLVQTTTGRVVASVMAAGFVVFAAYSFLEARYRAVNSGV